jgi:hypothetical protein
MHGNVLVSAIACGHLLKEEEDVSRRGNMYRQQNTAKGKRLSSSGIRGWANSNGADE